MEKLADRYHKLVVGLSLSNSDQDLVESSVNLAQALNAEIIFVHAVLPFQSYAYVGEGTLFPLSAYENSFRELSESQGVKKIRKLIDSARNYAQKSIQISFRISYAEPANGLIDIAEKENADMIICGYNVEQGENLFVGISTAHNLFSESKKPVLAIPSNRTCRFDQSIGFADACNEQSFENLKTVYSLACQLDMKTLYHIHIKDINNDEIDHMVDIIQNAIISGKIDSSENFTREIYMQKTKQALFENLEATYKKVLEKDKIKDLDYKCEVAFGSPKDEIKKLCEQNSCHIIAFGHHHIINRQTWSIGQIPYHSMLNLGLPVLKINHQ